MTPAFCHLHVHSEYSLLDGFCRIPALAAAVKAQGGTSVALTDHGSMAGTVQLLKAARKEGIKPILGVELYVARGSRRDQQGGREAGAYHLTVLARNQVGLRNLYRLTTEAQLTGFYYKPRVDHELLASHSEGLIVLSGCIASEINQALLQDDEAGAVAIADFYRSVFGDSYFVELQHHPYDPFPRLLAQDLALAQKLGVPVVATNDVHYIQEADARYQAMLSAIGRVQSGTETDYYLKDPAAMARAFAGCPEALANTLEIAERIEVPRLPDQVSVPLVPELREHEHAPDLPARTTALLRRRTLAGLHPRYGDPLPTEYQDRLDYELGVIEGAGVGSYLLLVAEICDFCRWAGIRFGPRGSAAGSLVVHGLGVAEPDPIAHRLVFERFINPERIDLPDVDLDIADDSRHLVYQYLVDTYGADRVSAVATFGTLGARAAIKDVGRINQVDYSAIEALTKAIPATASIKEAVEAEKVQALLQENPALRRVVEEARHLEGIARHASTHAAATVLANQPIVELAPLMRVPKSDGKAQVMYQGEELQAAGLLKMDLLGLDNLTVLDRALALIRERHHRDIDLWHLDWDDRATYELLRQGRTHGVFQLGTSSGRRVTREVQPESILDLMALVALNRPGPLDYVPKYAAVKNEGAPVESPHPLVDEIVRETNGVVVFQEQVLEIARRVAGFSYGQADLLRKAIGKKIESLLLEQKEKFIAGAQAHSGLSEEEATGIWQFFEPFARYGFNRGHACCYAYLAFQTAHVKAHYPLEFMCAVLDVARDSTEKIQAGIAECLALGIAVLPPSVQSSGVSFTIEGSGVRFGLSAVKGVSEETAAAIVEHRPYRSFGQLLILPKRALPKTALEALIKVGAVGFGTRAAELQLLEQIHGATTRQIRQLKDGQLALLDPTTGLAEPDPKVREVHESVYLGWERELCGVYLSAKPIEEAARSLGATLVCESEVGEHVTMVGELRRVRPIKTRRGEAMAFAELNDSTGVIATVCFPKLFTTAMPLWYEGSLVAIKGVIEERSGEKQLIARVVASPEECEREGVPDGWAKGEAASGGVGRMESETDSMSGSMHAVMAASTLAEQPDQEPEGDAPLQVLFPLSDPKAWVDAWAVARMRPGPVPCRLVLGQGPEAPSRVACVGVQAAREIVAISSLTQALRAH